MLADAEVQDPAVGVAFPCIRGAGGRDERRRSFDGGVVGLGEVGRPAPQFGHNRTQRVQDLPRRCTGGDILAGFEDGQGGVESGRKLLGFYPLQQCGALRVGRLPGLKGLVPFAADSGTAVDDGAGVGQDVLIHLEGLGRIEAQNLLESGYFISTEC